MKLLGLFLSLVVFASCSNEDSEITIDENTLITPSSLFQDKLLICHRGHGDFPENTITALKAAISVGYKAVECDIRVTLDGIFVLSHDQTIDRCSNGGGQNI